MQIVNVTFKNVIIKVAVSLKMSIKKQHPLMMKVYLPSFGFNATTIVISSLADCAQFNRLTLLEEKNNQL